MRSETLLEFDPTGLTGAEREAWINFIDKAGAPGAAAIFDFMVHWVVKLAHDGKTASQVREKVVGTFYDNVTLMKRGQIMRNETIMLAKAMVEQALTGAAVGQPSRVDGATSAQRLER
jgi:hypothetical protein